jgi:hypothetical protein
MKRSLKLKLPLAAAGKIVRHGRQLCGIFAFRTAQRQSADGAATPKNANAERRSRQRRHAVKWVENPSSAHRIRVIDID